MVDLRVIQVACQGSRRDPKGLTLICYLDGANWIHEIKSLLCRFIFGVQLGPLFDKQIWCQAAK